jgi:hypothetical protein
MKYISVILVLLISSELYSQQKFDPILWEKVNPEPVPVQRINQPGNVAAHFVLGLGVSIAATSVYRELGMKEWAAKLLGATTGFALCKMKENLYNTRSTGYTFGADALAFGLSFPMNDLIRLPYQRKAKAESYKSTEINNNVPESVIPPADRYNNSSISRKSPVDLKVIRETKKSALKPGRSANMAAEDQYNEGVRLLVTGSRENARQAFTHFYRCNQLVPGYQDGETRMLTAKNIASLTVIIDSIPVSAKTFGVNAAFFYNQVLDSLNNWFAEDSFIRFYSAGEAERNGIKNPDMVLKLGFTDFAAVDTFHTDKEQIVVRKVKTEQTDKGIAGDMTYKANLKSVTDKIFTRGQLVAKVTDLQQAKTFFSSKISGKYTWQNQYGTFTGNIEALNPSQRNLVEGHALASPSPQNLFIEFSSPIFEQLAPKLVNFFNKYN